MRVLIVEDEIKLAAYIKRGLEGEGYAVDVAADGETGLWQASNELYDVIVLDIMLPKMNGYVVCRELREQGIWTPILMLTAKSGAVRRGRGPRHRCRRLSLQAVLLRCSAGPPQGVDPPRDWRAPGRNRGRRPQAGSGTTALLCIGARGDADANRVLPPGVVPAPARRRGVEGSVPQFLLGLGIRGGSEHRRSVYQAYPQEDRSAL